MHEKSRHAFLTCLLSYYLFTDSTLLNRIRPEGLFNCYLYNLPDAVSGLHIDSAPAFTYSLDNSAAAYLGDLGVVCEVSEVARMVCRQFQILPDLRRFGSDLEGLALGDANGSLVDTEVFCIGKFTACITRRKVPYAAADFSA